MNKRATTRIVQMSLACIARVSFAIVNKTVPDRYVTNKQMPSTKNDLLCTLRYSGNGRFKQIGTEIEVKTSKSMNLIESTHRKPQNKKLKLTDW